MPLQNFVHVNKKIYKLQNNFFVIEADFLLVPRIKSEFKSQKSKTRKAPKSLSTKLLGIAKGGFVWVRIVQSGGQDRFYFEKLRI